MNPPRIIERKLMPPRIRSRSRSTDYTEDIRILWSFSFPRLVQYLNLSISSTLPCRDWLRKRGRERTVVMGFNYSNNRLVLIDMSYISSFAVFVVVAALAKTCPNVGTYPSPNDDHASIVSNGSLCPLSRCLVSVELSTHKSKAVH